MSVLVIIAYACDAAAYANAAVTDASADLD